MNGETRAGAGDRAAAGSGWLESAACAKVNLRLRIFSRARDGYHPLETIFCRIDLADHVRLRRRREPGVELSLSGPEWAPAGPENLAVRAAERFLALGRFSGGVEIELEKQIPPGSGLGGGSSDAAAVLRLLATTVDGLWGRDELMELAAGLGADVPFFAADLPLAFGWSRGDRLLPGPLLAPRPLLLALPELHISSAEAYADWDEHPAAEKVPAPSEPALLDWSAFSDWARLATLARNDFEPVVFDRHPSLGALKGAIEATRPQLALLSGSGSAVYGVYETAAERDAAAAALRDKLDGVRLISASGPV